MLNYNPLFHPFELPIQKLFAHCVTERPLFFPPRLGSTPGTTLAGTFGTALWSAVCHSNCNTSGEPHCQNPSECVVPWLYKPYSKTQHRNFARPVLLRAIELEGTEPVDVFTLEVTLWGRHAIAAQEAVKDTLKKMGELGLKGENELVRFNISKIETAPCLTLAQQIKDLPEVSSVLLEFQTPFLHKEKNEEGERQFHTDQSLPIISILGNSAYNLVAWDIEDRELSLDGKNRHYLARDARDRAWKAAEELLVVRSHLSSVDIGKRYSRGNQQTMSLQGFVGMAELTGDLKYALPWLLALSLAGGGQKRAMGFGSVRLWLGR
ncbi:MAG: CRISPR system precrRNA processing endoribonuclease RAMP protein Cas6 [Thiotrichaceae bacterium]|nr:CRISPR system precrRNA processing endoribonuclease RAMP protein Cas6 [Thiotrichaceae bacterium]